MLVPPASSGIFAFDVALDVQIISGGAVELLVVNDEPLKETFLGQGVQASHDE